MSKSYSKIRHILNSNTLLESRFLTEQNNSWTDFVSGQFDKIMSVGYEAMVGKKVTLSNSMFIYGRSMQFSGVMKDQYENQFTCLATILSVTKDKIFVKVSSLFYDSEWRTKIGEKGNQEILNNICLSIDKNDINNISDDVIQLSWLNSSVKSHIIDCNSVTNSGKNTNSDDCLKDFKISSGTKFGAGREYKYKEGKNSDGVIISFDFNDNKWRDSYRKILTGGKEEVGKWKCENGKFITYDKNVRYITYQ